MNLYTIDPSTKDGKEKLREIVSAIANNHASSSGKDGRASSIRTLYSFYNGTAYDATKINSIINGANKSNKPKRFVRYNLGRSKLRVLPNEFLGTPLQFSIVSVDRESNINRMNMYKTLESLSVAKPIIEEVQNSGYNVYEGMRIPDNEEVSQQGPLSIRMEHEVKMQRYIEEKKMDKDLKSKLLQEVISVINSNECFGKIEKDRDGRFTFRPIAPYNAIHVNGNEEWSDSDPYIGEYQRMDATSILRSLNLSDEQERQLKDSSNYGMVNNRIDGLYDVYTIQFLNRGEKVYYKTKNENGKIRIYEISEESYKKNRKSIEREVEKGLCSIEHRIFEKIYEVTYIASNLDILTNLRVIDAAFMNDGNGCIYPMYDYLRYRCNIGGDDVAEPISSIVKALDEDYDYIRYLINRELRKPHGRYMAYNEAFLPKSVKSYEELKNNMLDSGEIRYNTSVDGNVSETSGSNQTGIDSFELGSIQLITEMANYAISIEQTVERITGINESRSGLTKATATATTSNNNLEASRTMTYDIFWHVQRYGEKVLTLMCNKLKANPYEIDPAYSYSLMDENEKDRFLSTLGMTLSDFKAFVNDGRKDAAIIDYIKQTVFPQDIAAGKLTSHNVSEFLSKDTLVEAMEVLRRTDEFYNRMQSQSAQSATEAEQQREQMKIEGALQIEQQRGQNAINLSDRERDNKIAVNEHVEGLRSSTKQAIENMRTAAQERMSSSNNNHRHLDVDKTNQNALKKSILDGQIKKEIEASKPKAIPTKTKK